MENIQIKTKPKPLSQQDIMRRFQFYQLVFSNREATGNIIVILQLFNLVENKWSVIWLLLQVEVGKLKMELVTKYAFL